MLGPKRPDDYVGRDLDCQAAISQGIVDLINEATLSGNSEAISAAAIAGQTIPGIRDLLDDAVQAGWSETEAANAIRIVSARNV